MNQTASCVCVCVCPVFPLFATHSLCVQQVKDPVKHRIAPSSLLSGERGKEMSLEGGQTVR